ncbi:MAG: S-layer homology domain-containing protein [Candidatus Peribacteraceae bacterium]|nr:S-layer homology domain-containing protein [Candidatus Peribacteraceae bacterium]MDD5074271.1 S-layer homology domain-containing protein [Candidatus Peribacteraceae bacterium]
MPPLFSTQRIPLLAFASFIVFASVATVLRIPANLTSDMPTNTCGNGLLDAGEKCDDGNTISLDGCSATCTLEPCCSCSGSPSKCTCLMYCTRSSSPLGHFCGNRILEPSEECEAGISCPNGNSCDTSCRCNSVASSSSAFALCGNGRLDKGEDCEKGIATFANPCPNGEQCDAKTCLCPSRGKSEKYYPVAPANPVCGNGVCEKGEEMDCPGFGEGERACRVGTCPKDCTGGDSDACIGEGQRSGLASYSEQGVFPELQCCSGLNKIGIAVESSGGLCTDSLGGFLCTKSACGDGVCGKDENRCNCPDDCRKSSQTPVCGNKICEKGEELACPPCLPGSVTCTCSSCPQDCDNGPFRYAAWQCSDGSESKEGGPTSCKDRKTWEGYANDACRSRCGDNSAKCGVNGFKVWEPCGAAFASSVACIRKGEQGSFLKESAGKCCEGLSPIRHVKPDPVSNQCIGTNDGSFFCATCGNGSCEASDGENSCSCPADCGTQTQKCAEEGKNVYVNSEWGPVLCCSKNAGVKPSARAMEDDTCVMPQDGSVGTCVDSWWLTCGDGACGKGEDRCNCPKDCGKVKCGNGLLESGEQCEKNFSCPIPSCAAGAVCPGLVCNSQTCRCEREQVASSAASSIICSIPNCLGAIPTGTVDVNNCPVYACPVLSSAAYSSVTSVPPPAGFEDVILTVSSSSNPFSDTNIDTQEGEAAADLYNRGVVGGYPDGEFKGSLPVNRAEAAKFLLLAKFGTVPEPTGHSPFPDVLENQWYAKFVLTAAEKGIISGYPDGLFRPANTVNTAEFLKMMALTFGLPLNLPFTYTDVPADSWFAQYAGLAEFFHLFPGRTTQLFPQREVTRMDIVIAIDTYLNQ